MSKIEELFQKHLINHNEHLHQFNTLVKAVSELQQNVEILHQKVKENKNRTYIWEFAFAVLMSLTIEIVKHLGK
jgi:hypothetical protein